MSGGLATESVTDLATESVTDLATNSATQSATQSATNLAADLARESVSPTWPTSQYGLLRQRRFAPFFLTQFLGAANDNIFKIAFTGLVTFHAARFANVDASRAAFLISAVFILPFVLFSATAGQLADKLDKARIMRMVKNLEIVIMLIASAGFWLYSAPLLYLCTFLMGVHSTLFGPTKYAYLPQHLSERELTGGNGMVEMGTFVAILLGTIAGGALVDAGAGEVTHVVAGCVLVAVAGRVAAGFIPASPPHAPELVINWNPFTETWRNLRLAGAERTMLVALLGISWLWFFGATFLTSFFNFARDVLGGDAEVVTLLLALFSIGIGSGSLMCERLSGRRVELGLVPFGAIGMTLFAADLWWASRGLAPAAGGLVGLGDFLSGANLPGRAFTHWRIMVDLLLLSMFGGFYSVPLYAYVQAQSAPSHRARVIAALNILNALFMIVSAVFALALFAAGGTIPQLFLATAVLNLCIAAMLCAAGPGLWSAFVRWVRRRNDTLGASPEAEASGYRG